MKGKKLLDEFADVRIHGVLEDVLKNNDLYKKAQKKQDKGHRVYGQRAEGDTWVALDEFQNLPL